MKRIEEILVQPGETLISGSYYQAFWLIMGAFIIFSLISCKEETYAEVPSSQVSQDAEKVEKKDLIKRGEYLVTTIGCTDCHSPKKMGEKGPEEIPELALSGYQQGTELPKLDPQVLQNGWMLMNNEFTAAVGPWGVSFSANITSSETGIGNWSLAQFKTAIRKGKFKGMENGRDLLPPMPWFNYAKLSDEDLKAMYQYLQSTPPVDNIVPPPIPPSELATLKN
jgi:mono/diheme cytochrome c family protein